MLENIILLGLGLGILGGFILAIVDIFDITI